MGRKRDNEGAIKPCPSEGIWSSILHSHAFTHSLTHSSISHSEARTEHLLPKQAERKFIPLNQCQHSSVLKREVSLWLKHCSLLPVRKRNSSPANLYRVFRAFSGNSTAHCSPTHTCNCIQTGPPALPLWHGTTGLLSSSKAHLAPSSGRRLKVALWTVPQQLVMMELLLFVW